MMEDITIIFDESIEPENRTASVFIEGLPGIGHVGKLVTEHIIQELGAVKIAEITSIYFPPQVIIEDDGSVRLCNNEIYRYSGEKGSFLFLIGDFQSASNEGHYLLSQVYVDIARELGVNRIYTIGGYGVGHFIDTPRVIAAVNLPTLRPMVEEAGGIFGEGEPGGGIIGAAGLMLGIGAMVGIEGICLMGETSGYLVDPKSAALVLDVLTKMLGITIDPTNLTSRAGEMEIAVQKLLEQDKKADEELSYIG
ncbi:MAG TPA: proteasome assembly chaperone family protein [Methanospirillum sp.]|nr:proteasome assembly chaperone family protein [Methanospirillum sp.]